MSFRYTAPFVALCSLMLAATAYAEEALQLPTRKAGFWELKTTMDEGMGPKETSLKMCIDEAMEANTVRTSMQEHKKNCAKYEVTKADGKTVVDATCVFSGRDVTSRTEMSGDFVSTFNVKIESTTSDTRQSTNQTVSIKRTIVQEGKFLGAACGDVKPGFAIAPDGATIAVQ